MQACYLQNKDFVREKDHPNDHISLTNEHINVYTWFNIDLIESIY